MTGAVTAVRAGDLDPGQVFRGLAALRSACVLYPDGHPAIEAQIDDVLRQCESLLGERETARIDVIRGVINLNAEPHHQASRLHARVLEEFAALGVDSIHLDRGLTRDEIQSLGEFLAREHAGPGSGIDVGASLVERGVERVSLGRILPIAERLADRTWPEMPEVLHDAEYRETTEGVRLAFESARRGNGLDVRTIRGLLEVLVGRVARSPVAMGQVMMLKEYENMSYLHSVNAALLSVRLAERLGFSSQDQMVVAEAALLHDIGKMKVPREILTKRGRLTDREWRAVRRHPQLGAEMLTGLDGLGSLTPLTALEHHLNYSGGGYPDLGARRIPHRLSQLVAVADVYESVTGARSYREPAEPQQACLILARMAGAKLNPALVHAFVSVVTFFPVGSVVETTRGEIGVVTDTHEDDALHPRVALFEAGRTSVGGIVDLRERRDAGSYAREVARVVPEAEVRALGIDVPEVLSEAGRDGDASL